MYNLQSGVRYSTKFVLAACLVFLCEDREEKVYETAPSMSKLPGETLRFSKARLMFIPQPPLPPRNAKHPEQSVVPTAVSNYMRI